MQLKRGGITQFAYHSLSDGSGISFGRLTIDVRFVSLGLILSIFRELTTILISDGLVTWVCISDLCSSTRGRLIFRQLLLHSGKLYSGLSDWLVALLLQIQYCMDSFCVGQLAVVRTDSNIIQIKSHGQVFFLGTSTARYRLSGFIIIYFAWQAVVFLEHMIGNDVLLSLIAFWLDFSCCRCLIAIVLHLLAPTLLTFSNSASSATSFYKSRDPRMMVKIFTCFSLMLIWYNFHTANLDGPFAVLPVWELLVLSYTNTAPPMLSWNSGAVKLSDGVVTLIQFHTLLAHLSGCNSWASDSIIHDPLLVGVTRSWKPNNLCQFVTNRTLATEISRYAQLHLWRQSKALLLCWNIEHTGKGIIFLVHLLADSLILDRTGCNQKLVVHKLEDLGFSSEPSAAKGTMRFSHAKTTLRSSMHFLQIPWDPGGTMHRLEGKPRFKKGGMSGTALGWALIWAMGLGLIEHSCWTTRLHLQEITRQQPGGHQKKNYQTNQRVIPSSSFFYCTSSSSQSLASTADSSILYLSLSIQIPGC